MSGCKRFSGAYSKGTFVCSRDDEDDAWAEAAAQAKQLRAMGWTDRYGIQVRPVRVKKSWSYWVELVDRKAA